MDALRARIRKRDQDIILEIEKRNLTKGELSNIIREGVRIVLFERKVKPWNRSQC